MILDLEIVKFDIFSILKANKFVIGKKVVSEIVEFYSTKKTLTNKIDKETLLCTGNDNLKITPWHPMLIEQVSVDSVC